MAGQDQPTTTSPPSASASNDGSSGRHGIDEQIAERRAKLAALAAAGVAVHPYRFDRTATTAELHASYADLAPDAHTGAQARVAGRLLAVRGHGKLEFADLHDESGRIQLLLEHDKLDETSQLVVANLDVGDWVGAEGEVVTSRRGELSIEVAAAVPAHQGPPAAARPPCRRGRSGDEVPRARGRPDRQRRRQAGLRRPPPHDRRAAHPAAVRGLHRGGDPDPAGSGRWRHRPALHDPLQRARRRPQPADRARALPQAAHRGRL